MISKHDKIVMRAVVICYKPFLKPEEAMINCNLGRTQLCKKCNDFSVHKNSAGYLKREDLDRKMSGELSFIEQKANQIRIKFR
jgi:hypothetical protein